MIQVRFRKFSCILLWSCVNRQLVEQVQTMLAARKLGEEMELGDTDFDFRVHSKSQDAKAQRKKEQEEFYFPALPPEMMRGT